MAYATPMPSGEFLWNVFQSVDRDHSGAISAEELQAALSNGTWSPFNLATIKLMIAMFDKQGNGTINLDEFGALWKYVTDWQNCFRSFDRDNSGSIDPGEFSTALQSFGYRLNPATVHVLMNKFDSQKRGSILFDDFIRCCVTLNTLTAAFRDQDKDLDGVITIHYEQFISMVLTSVAL